MSAIVIVGAQWGDEGKGKVVDLLAEKADVVVRYAGGPNAGHTLVIGDDKMVFRLVPSGILHPHSQCLLGQGMVINGATLMEEIATLKNRGLTLAGRLWLSDRAHLILPYHVQLDGLREASRSRTTIGTTKRGIGPCYEDKVGRRGIRLGDLRDLKHAEERVRNALATWTPVFAALDAKPPAVDEIMPLLETQAAALGEWICDTATRLDELQRGGKKIMLEGAQGTLLDIDHGTYPYVTSSSAVAGGACTGAGIGPSRIGRVLGITKAYTTRVGGGPFPTELDDAAGQHLRDTGHEYGSVTGRPRRTGWLDLVALKYARTVNGLDALALTKLDVLSGLDEVKLCVAYDTPSGRSETLPTELANVTPVYETLPGWSEPLQTCRELSALPANARALLDRISDHMALPIALVSVGPRRSETIVVDDLFAD